MKERYLKANSVLYPAAGIMVFCLLSFSHDGFRTDRSIDTYYLPISVGLATGSIIGYLRTKTEIQTRVYERKLSKEREDAVLGRAAATIAHEVRNPLNVLAMGLQRLQIENREISPEHRRLVDLMLESIFRANGIIGNLLNYARQQRPRLELLYLDQLVDEFLVLYRPLCDEKGIEIRWRMGFNTPVVGDPGLLRQVVDNLLRNAIEAQPAGGFVDIELRGDDRFAALLVRNDGFSLPSMEAERIFEPYFTTKAQGTGLGVPIARRIVEAHGGTVGVHVEGGRLEIEVRLPLTATVPG